MIDFKGEKALEVFADLLEPATEIINDKKVKELFQKKGTPLLKVVKVAIKEHKKEVVQIMAILNDKTVEEYTNQISILTLPMEFLQLVNNPAIKELFTLQGQNADTMNSGSAMENTEETGTT